ncbi:MAG: hypothetical protein IH624_04295 [Phycisphaerae bacterium]|nr:hypothetical protein [Phycisphaerae bacterium]
MAVTSQSMYWEDLTDEEILNLRVKDLGLRIKGSTLEPLIDALYAELEDRGVRFPPACYLADEWLCPEGEPIIGIPFCLAHPRLKRIELRMMYEVEGDTEQSCMKLLRHECGHALNYAYRLHTRTRWRELFGSFSVPYSQTYDYQPYSRRFVVHLGDHYAQAHPDEDFAETFAVWLDPGNDWRHKYEHWPAIKKLNYVDTVMKKAGDTRPLVTSPGHPPWSASRMTSTLHAYYNRKRKDLGSDFRGYYDDSLKNLFTDNPRVQSAEKASKLLRHYRRAIIDDVARWTGHRKYDLHQLMDRFIARSDALRLYAEDDTQDAISAAALLAAIAGGTHRPAARKHV